MPVVVTLGEQGGLFGRNPDCDLVLSDPENIVSKRHGSIDFIDGNFWVADNSVNGLYLNGEADPIGRGQRALLHDGDRLSAGNYDIAVGIMPTEAAGDQDRPSFDRGSFPGDDYAFPEAFADSHPPAPNFSDDSPLFPASDRLPEDSSWLELPTPDHAPIEQAAIKLPEIITPATAPGSIFPPGWNPLDDDDISPQLEPPAVAPASTPAARALPEEAGTGAASSLPRGGADAARLLQAFLDGAGLSAEDVAQVDPEVLLRTAGERLRELSGGVRSLLATRARIKAELRVEQTLISGANNNPLKISVDDEQALLALLLPAARGFMPSDKAIEQAFRDLQAHELALVSGARQAVADIVAHFDPAILMQRLDSGSLVRLLPAARKARYWELFEAEFRRVREEAEEATSGPLGRSLARAYEDQDNKW